ncbi:MAG: molybdenum cofactor guanylyltransferase [Nibricoccus sp.]
MSDAKIAFTGVMMAGGRSTRMGRDKALLTLEDGRTLLERAFETLWVAGATDVFLSVGAGKKYGLPGAREISDLQKDCGPMGGLAACFVELQLPLCLVLAVDMPTMTPAYLSALTADAESGCGIVPVIDGSAEPLAAVYPKEAAAEVIAAIQAREFSLQRLVRKLEQKKLVRLRTVSAAERRFFANWNSPEDCR